MECCWCEVREYESGVLAVFCMYVSGSVATYLLKGIRSVRRGGSILVIHATEVSTSYKEHIT